MRLYGFWRSSAAYRVRIALALKGVEWESVAVDLPADGQRRPDFLALNPQALVPALEDGGAVLAQSLAILEYLEETRPEPALLPAGAAARAEIRRLAAMVACDIHPLGNLRVLRYLRSDLGADEAAVTAWIHHWIGEGFRAMEALLAGRAGRFCHGDAPTLADVCLVPQMYNARRFGLDLAPYPTLVRVDAACTALPAFAAAAPEAQPDRPA